MKNNEKETAFQLLKETLEKVIIISDFDWRSIARKFKLLKVARHALLTKENEVATSIYFISKGILRIFYLKDDTEITGFIFSEGLFASAYESFLLQAKSNQALEALEDCVLLSIDYSSLQTLYKKVPALQIVARVIAEQRFINGQRILSSHLLDKPEERYQKFISQYPELVQRVPQHIIASFLGITAVSLSRIRKRVSKK